MRATRSVRRRRGGEGGYVRDGDSFENNEEAGGEKKEESELTCGSQAWRDFDFKREASAIVSASRMT